MQKQSIKKITVTRLLQVFVVSVLVIVAIVAVSYRNFFQFVVENKIQSISQIIKAGLTSHMKAGIMDKREYFLNEISSVHDIRSIEIIRGDAVIKDYGESCLSEKKLTDNLRAILEKKGTYIEWRDTENLVEAVVPYIASSSGSFNCMQCHNVEEGALLGAVNISMEIGSYQNFVLKNGYMIVGVLFLFALAITLNMFHVIERYIRKPLLNIISDSETAYTSHQDINSEKYESKEFENVAHNVNKFNKTVIEKEDELKIKNKQLQLLNEEIESTLKETMLAVGQIEEIRAGDTNMHTQRVAAISTMIAKDYGLSDEQIKLIEITSPLHDIGKIGITDAVLNKPARLTEGEYVYMKTHAFLGYRILNNSERKVLKTAATIAHEHHEKYDGTGYPQGLKGEEISIYARIVAIVDVLDALLSKRVYKEKWELKDAIVFFKEERGKHFDPELVDVLLENMDSYVQIINKLSKKD
ncbi:MAG: HD domain-containing protein [Sulfurimonas sp.]|nr:HD domain-containing protein [Sulfurimonas sp.]